MNNHPDEHYLDMAAEFAKHNTTCRKVAVGSCFVSNSNGDTNIYLTANSGVHNCIKEGYCYKARVTGIYESSELTRKFCKATHSEIRMIEVLKNAGRTINKGDTLFVTRYPCINCAKAIDEFGFKSVIYGGVQEISDEVKEVFDKSGISYKWYPENDYEFQKEQQCDCGNRG